MVMDTNWVNCPICDEPDMRQEVDGEGYSLIFCTNHGCESNNVRKEPTEYPHKHVEWRGYDAIITMHWAPLFPWGKVTVNRYRGSGTVWHDAVTGKRQPTHIESRLADIWTKARWEKENG